MTAPLRRRARLLTFGLLCLVSYAYFYEGGGWNQNSRFDLILAVLLRRTVCIDAFHDNTGDRALYNGHYYMDKAPGASFTALPAVSLARRVLKFKGDPVAHPEKTMWLSYAAQIAASAIPGAIAAICVFWIAIELGASEGAALLAAGIYGLASPAWAYAIVLYGHALSAACLMLAVGFILSIRRSRSPRDEIAIGAAIGLAAGWAVVTEYPVAVAAVVLAVAALAEAGRGGRGRMVRVGAAMAVTALACASVLMVYQYFAFGSPFRVGYAYYDDPRTMKTGLLGIGSLNPHILGELLFGWYRGLIPVVPVFILTPIGLWMLVRSRTTRIVGVALTAAIVIALVMMGGDVHWEGGWAYGPRYLAFVMGFMAVALAPVWDRGNRIVRALLIVLALAGAASTIVAVSTTVQPAGDEFHPMRDVQWPAFRSGELALNTQSFLDIRRPPHSSGLHAAWNAGMKMGFDGLASLVPLGIVWIVGAWALWYLRPDAT